MEPRPEPPVGRTDLAEVAKLLTGRDHPLALDAHDDVVGMHCRFLHLLKTRFDPRRPVGFLRHSLASLGSSQEEDPAQLIDAEVVVEQYCDLGEPHPEVAQGEDPM